MAGIKRLLKLARENVNREIAANRGDGSNLYAKGLASEGYAGGYYQALCDVELALNGCLPNTRGYWEKRR